MYDSGEHDNVSMKKVSASEDSDSKSADVNTGNHSSSDSNAGLEDHDEKNADNDGTNDQSISKIEDGSSEEGVYLNLEFALYK